MDSVHIFETSNKQKHTVMKNFENYQAIQEGQTITFKVPGHGAKLYTRKVQEVCVQRWNPEYVSFNVNPVGCGTLFHNVNAWDVVSVK